MDNRIFGFPPVIGDEPRILILGSMPSVKSLEEAQYYAHPRNAFWRIQAALFDEEFTEDYNERILRLKRHRIALWDSVSSCVRPGSLDSNITEVIPNDLPTFLHENPSIGHIFFNGSASQQIFKKYHRHLMQKMDTALLPSTSAAAARLTFEEKLERWRSICEFL